MFFLFVFTLEYMATLMVAMCSNIAIGWKSFCPCNSRLCRFENVTRASASSINKAVSSQWVKFQVWEKYPFNTRKCELLFLKLEQYILPCQQLNPREQQEQKCCTMNTIQVHFENKELNRPKSHRIKRRTGCLEHSQGGAEEKCLKAIVYNRSRERIFFFFHNPKRDNSERPEMVYFLQHLMHLNISHH